MSDPKTLAYLGIPDFHAGIRSTNAEHPLLFHRSLGDEAAKIGAQKSVFPPSVRNRVAALLLPGAHFPRPNTQTHTPGAWRIDEPLSVPSTLPTCL